MGTIIGQMHTPEDSGGKRDVLHPETQIDAVLDPVSGVPLRDQLDNITDQLHVVDTEKGTPGFVTPEMITELQQQAENAIVVDSVKPTFASGGYWFNIYDTKMSENDT